MKQRSKKRANPLNGKMKGSCILTTWQTNSDYFSRKGAVAASVFDAHEDTGVAFFPGVRYRITVEVVGYDRENDTSLDNQRHPAWSLTYPDVIKRARAILRDPSVKRAHPFAREQLSKARGVIRWLARVTRMRKYIDTLSLSDGDAGKPSVGRKKVVRGR
jgi:hypothetical protein